MKKRSITSEMLRMLMVAGLLAAVACGSDDDDDGDTIINLPAEQQREEGTVPTGPSVVINQTVNNNVRIINKKIRVEKNNLIMNYRVVEADPVVHQQFIYVAPNCNQIVNADIDNNNMVDQTEVEQATGAPVAQLQEQEGAEFEQEQTIPLSALPPESEDFVFVVYGAEEGVTVPIVCNEFKVNLANSTTTNEPTPEEPTPEQPAPEQPAPEQPAPEQPAPTE